MMREIWSDELMYGHDGKTQEQKEMGYSKLCCAKYGLNVSLFVQRIDSSYTLYRPAYGVINSESQVLSSPSSPSIHSYSISPLSSFLYATRVHNLEFSPKLTRKQICLIPIYSVISCCKTRGFIQKLILKKKKKLQ